MKWPSPFLIKMGTYFSVVTKIRENAPDKANGLRLVSREPQESLVPEGYFESYQVAVLQSSYFSGSTKEAALLFQRLGFILFF